MNTFHKIQCTYMNNKYQLNVFFKVKPMHIYIKCNFCALFQKTVHISDKLQNKNKLL